MEYGCQGHISPHTCGDVYSDLSLGGGGGGLLRGQRLSDDQGIICPRKLGYARCDPGLREGGKRYHSNVKWSNPGF